MQEDSLLLTTTFRLVTSYNISPWSGRGFRQVPRPPRLPSLHLQTTNMRNERAPPRPTVCITQEAGRGACTGAIPDQREGCPRFAQSSMREKGKVLGKEAVLEQSQKSRGNFHPASPKLGSAPSCHKEHWSHTG
eukprot:364247-Chlamydomonas_euryale.AAC.2